MTTGSSWSCHLSFLEKHLCVASISKYLGAMHPARWMSKVIYSIKMWLFRNQFKMTSFEIREITDIVILVVTLYLRAWITASWAIKALNNDFTLMKALVKYPHKAI